MYPSIAIARTEVPGYSISTILIPNRLYGKSKKDLYETTIFATHRETNGKLLNGMRMVTRSVVNARYTHFDFVSIAGKQHDIY